MIIHIRRTGSERLIKGINVLKEKEGEEGLKRDG